jgi:hypothetical protein
LLRAHRPGNPFCLLTAGAPAALPADKQATAVLASACAPRPDLASLTRATLSAARCHSRRKVAPPPPEGRMPAAGVLALDIAAPDLSVLSMARTAPCSCTAVCARSCDTGVSSRTPSRRHEPPAGCKGEATTGVL